jgi:hypothetical protein
MVVRRVYVNLDLPRPVSADILILFQLLQVPFTEVFLGVPRVIKVPRAHHRPMRNCRRSSGGTVARLWRTVACVSRLSPANAPQKPGHAGGRTSKGIGMTKTGVECGICMNFYRVLSYGINSSPGSIQVRRLIYHRVARDPRAGNYVRYVSLRLVCGARR